MFDFEQQRVRLSVEKKRYQQQSVCYMQVLAVRDTGLIVLQQDDLIFDAFSVQRVFVQPEGDGERDANRLSC